MVHLTGRVYLQLYLRESEMYFNPLEGIPLKRVSIRLKTVINSSAKCQLSVKFERKMPIFGLFTLFSVLQKSYLVKGLDCNKKYGTQVLLLMPF